MKEPVRNKILRYLLHKRPVCLTIIKKDNGFDWRRLKQEIQILQSKEFVKVELFGRYKHIDLTPKGYEIANLSHDIQEIYD